MFFNLIHSCSLRKDTISMKSVLLSILFFALKFWCFLQKQMVPKSSRLFGHGGRIWLNRTRNPFQSQTPLHYSFHQESRGTRSKEVIGMLPICYLIVIQLIVYFLLVNPLSSSLTDGFLIFKCSLISENLNWSDIIMYFFSFP